MCPKYFFRSGLVALMLLVVGGDAAFSQENPLEPTEILDESDGDGGGNDDEGDGYDYDLGETPTRGADGNLIEEILITSQKRDTHDEQSISV